MSNVIQQRRQVYRFGPFQLVPEERLLLRDDVPVPLTGKCFDLLVVLVENNGRLVEKGALMERVWPEGFVEEANLSVTISTLRRLLGESPKASEYIQTVPRHGYRFLGPVEEYWEGETASETRSHHRQNSAPTLNVREQPTSPLRRSQRGLIAVSVVSLLAAMLFGLNSGGFRHRLIGGNPAIRSLAVMPLENRSGDSAQDYFSHGLTEALITDMSGIDGLRVISLQSVLQHKGTRKSAEQIGQELKVDAVVRGSAVRSEGRMRLALELIHTESNRRLWSGKYERNLQGAVAMQREAARDIVHEIGIEPQKLDRIRQAPSVDPQAYDHYLRGQYFLHRQSKEGNESAIAWLERAVKADPDFAAAHANLAQAYVWKLYLFAPGDKALPEKAFVATEKALALDPDSAVGHLARGRLLWTPANHFPHEKAIREYRRALELNPNLDEARNQLALVYCHIGMFDEALAESRQAVLTNPNNNMAQFRAAQTLNFQGKYEEALAALGAIPLDSNPALLGYQTAWSLFNLGRKEEASAMLAQLQRDHPQDPGGVYTSVQAVIAASGGNRKEAEEKIRAAVAIGKGFGHFHHTAYHLGIACALLGRRAEAIKWLDSAAEDGFPCFPLFASDSNLDSLRQEPQFLALLSKLKRHWEEYRKVL